MQVVLLTRVQDSIHMRHQHVSYRLELCIQGDNAKAELRQ